MSTLELLGTDPNAFDYCDAISIPVPWDPVLQAQYQELLEAVAAWLDEPDGADGTKGDHVYLVPISMPSILGSEMQIGFGPDIVCPDETDGAGVEPRSHEPRSLDGARERPRSPREGPRRPGRPRSTSTWRRSPTRSRP